MTLALGVPRLAPFSPPPPVQVLRLLSTFCRLNYTNTTPQIIVYRHLLHHEPCSQKKSALCFNTELSALCERVPQNHDTTWRLIVLQ